MQGREEGEQTLAMEALTMAATVKGSGSEAPVASQGRKDPLALPKASRNLGKQRGRMRTQ